jgi:RsiW-degrading membrane proteinase PrsW (M82 family)
MARMKCGKFQEHLISTHPNIRFTMQTEEANLLPFLDVLVKRTLYGSLGHTVYRKPTYTNLYLCASSHHHPAQKCAILSTLI